jgi:hypothetical protein
LEQNNILLEDNFLEVIIQYHSWEAQHLLQGKNKNCKCVKTNYSGKYVGMRGEAITTLETKNYYHQIQREAWFLS